MAKPYTDVAGQRFHYLTAIRHIKLARWLCRCDCGKERVVYLSYLRNGMAKSCGCKNINSAKTHGLSRTPAHRAWVSMRSRCHNPQNHPNWENYGGRGISVCERWNSFENFLADMGERPNGTSIDRIDVNGIYEPGNCRWATAREQANNRRDARRLTFQGRTMSCAEWARELGMTRSKLHIRLFRLGWSVERALTE